MLTALRGWTPRQWAAVKWLVLGLFIAAWIAVNTWSAFASVPKGPDRYGWVEWSPCQFEWADLKLWRGDLVSDAAAIAAGCPHGDVQLP